MLGYLVRGKRVVQQLVGYDIAILAVETAGQPMSPACSRNSVYPHLADAVNGTRTLYVSMGR